MWAMTLLAAMSVEAAMATGRPGWNEAYSPITIAFVMAAQCRRRLLKALADIDTCSPISEDFAH